MKHIWTTLALIAFTASVSHAQKTPVEKYELVPDGHMEVYFDYVSRFNGKSFNTPTGEYIGQTSREGHPYGYGMFIGNDGAKVTGMFREGKLLFGITQTRQSTIVGSPEKYVSYSNTTGRPEYIVRNQEQLIMEGPEQYNYGFVTMRYANGDQYMGEIFMNRRHGFGIYYYANGDIWYGPYENDIRNGYGVLFTEADGILLGEWRGEQVTKVIPVKFK